LSGGLVPSVAITISHHQCIKAKITAVNPASEKQVAVKTTRRSLVSLPGQAINKKVTKNMGTLRPGYFMKEAE